MTGDNECPAAAEKENVAPVMNKGRVSMKNSLTMNMSHRKSKNASLTISSETNSTSTPVQGLDDHSSSTQVASMEESMTIATDKGASGWIDLSPDLRSDKEAPTSPPSAPRAKSKKSFTLTFNRRSLAIGIGVQQRSDLSSVNEDTLIEGEGRIKSIFPLDVTSDGEADGGDDTKTKRTSRGEHDQGGVTVTRSPSSESGERSGVESIVEEEKSLGDKTNDFDETIITINDNEYKEGNDRGPTGALVGGNTDDVLQHLLEEQVVREQRLATLEAENVKLNKTIHMAEDAPQPTPKTAKKNLFSWALPKTGKSPRSNSALFSSKSPKLAAITVAEGDQESRASTTPMNTPGSTPSNDILKLKQGLEEAQQIAQKLLEERKRTAKFLKERFISLQNTKSGADSSGSSSHISQGDFNEGPFCDPRISKSLSHLSTNLLKTMTLEDFLDPNRSTSECVPTPKSTSTWRTKFKSMWSGTKNDVEQWEKWIKNWESFQNTKRVRNLLWGAEGVPNEIRGELWLVCLEPRLYREITTVLYGMLQNRMATVRAKRDDESNLNTEESSLLESLKQLELDLDRTLPRLMSGEKRVFGCEGPKGVELGNILEIFSAFRPDIGYCQGMSFLAAMVALHIENEVDQFRAFMHVVNLPFFYAAYTFDMTVLRGYFAIFDVVFEEFLPILRSHFVQLEVDCSIFLTEWWFTCFVRSLPLRIACRFWDGLMIHGESMLFWASIALLHYYEAELLKCETFDEVLMLLTTKPGDIDSDRFWELWAQQNWPKQIRINPIM